MAYYSPGDEVVYAPKGCNAKIIRGYINDDYMVEFEDKNLIPPQMRVPSNTLTPREIPTLFGGYIPKDIDGFDGFFDNRQASNNKETNCPKCQGLWTETWIGHKAYYDCIKCNLKREDSI